jgi:glycosyltransferase involved in cell wall biosynthesis
MGGLGGGRVRELRPDTSSAAEAEEGPGGAAARGPARIAVVVKGWPRLSETFIAQELVGLERRGFDLVLFSLRLPTDPAVHALARDLKAPVVYLPEYLHREPLRVVRALARAVRLPGWWRAVAVWARDLVRDRSRNRLRRFGQAAVMAVELPGEVGWIYAHFLHTPASVARYAALMTGRPWSFSAHAKDIWTTPDWEKREKLAEARWGVTCTRAGQDHLAALAPDPGRVELVYHGLDLTRFPAACPARPPRDGADPADPVRLLSVGRAVPKKGLDVALSALAALPPGLNWRWVHVGGGAGLPALEDLARRLGVDDRVTWLGPQAQERVVAEYEAADLFLLPSRIAEDGDRDGLPNVLMEAQALGLPVVSTRLPGIEELVVDGSTGVLVPPDDPAALAAALEELARDPELRSRLGRAGWDRVRCHFSAEQGLDRLAGRLGSQTATIPGSIPP